MIEANNRVMNQSLASKQELPKFADKSEPWWGKVKMSNPSPIRSRLLLKQKQQFWARNDPYVDSFVLDTTPPEQDFKKGRNISFEKA